eukprot:Awhi_evm1s8386
MFHVSTLLPNELWDRQRLARKRHIGNDIAAIVFVEGDTVFDPESITSHFLHVFIVVQPIINAETPDTAKHYRVSVVNKNGLEPYPPSCPPCATFQRGPEFQQ